MSNPYLATADLKTSSALVAAMVKQEGDDGPASDTLLARHLTRAWCKMLTLGAPTGATGDKASALEEAARLLAEAYLVQSLPATQVLIYTSTIQASTGDSSLARSPSAMLSAAEESARELVKYARDSGTGMAARGTHLRIRPTGDKARDGGRILSTPWRDQVALEPGEDVTRPVRASDYDVDS